MLYLTGFGLELDDLEQFRQWGSRTPGHPEDRHTAGVEVTTGPLGQGFANARRHGASPRRTCAPASAPSVVRPPHVRASAATATSWRASATRPRRSPATSASAASSASTTTTTSRSTAPPSSRYSDDVAEAVRGLRLARRAARRGRQRPRRARGGAARRRWPRTTARRCSCCAATSATRRPKFTDTAEAHGNPLGADEVARGQGDPRAAADEDFFVPDDVLALLPRRRPPRGRRRARRGRSASTRWTRRPRPAWTTRAWPAPGLAGWEAKLPTLAPGEKIATRGAIGKVLNAIARRRARADRRRRRPHRQHRHELKDAAAQSQPTHARRPPDPLRHPRARHGRGHERHGRARRRAARRRHVLRVQRLHAPAGAARRAHRRPRSCSCGRTTRSASARTARPTSRSSSSRRCGRCPACA